MTEPTFRTAARAFDAEGYFIELVYWHGALYPIQEIRPRREYL